MCNYKDCKTKSNFNFENEKKAIYCSKHKLEGMINIKDKICEYHECNISPIYNFENEKTGKFCNKHKLEGMTNIIHKTCQYENCKTQPVYNFINEKIPQFCSIHKLEGMVNILSKECQYENCKKQPTYNFENEKIGKFCSTHKLNGMIDIKSKKCEHENCKKIPNFNYENEKIAIFCSEHKKEGMIDIKNKKCKTLMCYTQVKDKYEGYCLYCFINTFPDKPVSRNYKTKEYSVVEYIKTKFPDLTWISDKKVKDGCSKRRPDLLLDLGYQIIIIEIDENQHSDYDCSCENKRIMEISQDLGHRPIVFIRFNPDDYIDNGKNITSCWNNNKLGICTVKKSKQNEWSYRLNVLEETINYWINPNNTTDKIVEIIQLYYDK